MKKLFFISSFLFSTILSAQTAVSKGTYTVGGNISFTTFSFENSNETNSTFKVNPEFGYFFIDHFYTAVSLDFERYSFGRTTVNMYGIGPSIRYYTHNEGVVPFLGASFSYLWDKYSSPNSDEITSTELKFTGGLSFFITDYFAVESAINYSFFNYKYPSGFYTDGSKAQQFNVGIGASYYIH